MKPHRLFSTELLLSTDNSSKKEIVTAISLKKGDIFFAKYLPENIKGFAETRMTKSGCVILIVLMDILISAIGLDKNIRRCDRILFIREDLKERGGKGLGFVTGKKCRTPFDQQFNKTDISYTYGGVQCMLLYEGERVWATNAHDPFGKIFKKIRKPAILLPRLGIRNYLGQQLSKTV
jgi:hypothetical protein